MHVRKQIVSHRGKWHLLGAVHLVECRYLSPSGESRCWLVDWAYGSNLPGIIGAYEAFSPDEMRRMIRDWETIKANACQGTFVFRFEALGQLHQLPMKMSGLGKDGREIKGSVNLRRWLSFSWQGFSCLPANFDRFTAALRAELEALGQPLA